MRTPKDIAVVPSDGATREPLVRRRRRIPSPLPMRVEWLAAESFPLTEEALDAVERLLGPELEKLLAQSERDERSAAPPDQAPCPSRVLSSVAGQPRSTTRTPGLPRGSSRKAPGS
jgi:hypothetical protein